MGFSVPPSKNYPSALIKVPSIIYQEPREGRNIVPCDVDWQTMGGDNMSVYINLANNSTLEISQIVSVSIDNSLCAADVVFTFPDIASTVTIPAYAPWTVFNVPTRSLALYVGAPSARAGDKSVFQLHNYFVDPIAVPITVEQQTLSNNNILADGTGAILIPAGINGTLGAINVYRCGPLVNNTTETWAITDGTGLFNISGQFSAAAIATVNQTLLNLNPCHLRFENGLYFTQGGTVNGGGAYVINGLYKTP